MSISIEIMKKSSVYKCPAVDHTENPQFAL